MGNEKTKNIILGSLIVGMITMTVAYAVLTQTLNINNNTGVIKKSSWSVLFTEKSAGNKAVAYPAGSATTAVVNTQPTLSATTISGLKATLQVPGDRVEYVFNVENQGDINAILKTFTITKPTCTSTDTNAQSICNNYLTYSLVYTSNSQAVAANDTLDASAKKEIKLTLELKDTIPATSLPKADINVSNLTATFNYQQN